MDAVAVYYDWIHSLVDLFIKDLEEVYGKKFGRDAEMTLGAAKHSEQMMLKGYPYKNLGEFTGPTLFEKIELVKDGIAFYNQPSIEEAIKEMVYGILNSLNYEWRPFIKNYRFIGVGIAIRENKPGETAFCLRPGGITLYATLRLKLE